ncbi:MAG: TetR/AcrR family transcriptional regulator [Dehalococcoidales bacterium]
MDGFERRKEQSKEDIRRAAEELFSKFGADKVSVNDIARKAGVSQATIYNNFGSKDELVHDYHNMIVKMIASRFREILVWKKSYVEKLQGFLQSWIDIADRYKIEIKDSETKPSRDAIGIEIENSFREFIKEGKDQGDLRSDLSDQAIIAYFKFFQQGISNNPGISDRMRRNSKLSRDLLSLFMYGISGQSG